MDDRNAELQEKLQELRESYLLQLPGKLAEIEALWQRLQDTWVRETADKLYRICHSIAGSAGTFGLGELSEKARAVEQVLKDAFQEDRSPSTGERDGLVRMFEELARAATKQGESGKETKWDLPVFQSPADRHSVYLLDDDRTLAQALATQIERGGYHVSVFETFGELETAVFRQPPAALILDVVFPEGPLAGPEFGRRLQRLHSTPFPVLFISAKDDLASRLEAVRADGDAFFTKPVDMALLLDRLDTLTASKDPTLYRILIVDDERELGDHFATVLNGAGLEAMAIDRPLTVMRALSDFKPDLLLLDVHMKECTGLELAKVIRQNRAYLGLPIVFLSSETNLEEQFKALRMGGDDFLTKPIRDDHLISAVVTRAHRARELSSIMVQDSLTGLLNHRKTKEQLRLELLRAKRQNSHLSFAMVDIDHFKSVNDTYGHMTGDRVIQSLSRLLQDGLRRTDTVGRYGGEEFAIIFPDTAGQAAAEVLDRLRRRFSEMPQGSGGQTFTVTFSAGVATFPEHANADTLNQVADEALYAAKKQGRNRVILAGGSN